jgi:DNA-binding HxlR family transcriptional regulator
MLRVMAKTYHTVGDCPVARTLELIGERWTILLLRDLLLHGPRRFHDFETSMGKVAPTTLSARLKDLEANGLVCRRLYTEHPPRLEYQLTDKGKSLGPVVAAMRDWGLKNASANVRPEPPTRRDR